MQIDLAFKNGAWVGDPTKIRRAFRQHGPMGTRALDVVQRLVRGSVGELTINVRAADSQMERTGTIKINRHGTKVTFFDGFGSAEELAQAHAGTGWGEQRTMRRWVEDNLDKSPVEHGVYGAATVEEIPGHTYTSFVAWVEAIDQVENQHMRRVDQMESALNEDEDEDEDDFVTGDDDDDDDFDAPSRGRADW